MFADLAIRMVGLGLLTGIAFPPFVLLLGVDPDHALTPRFFAATVAAGLMVGGVNFLLCRVVVGERARLLGAQMQLVGEAVRHAAGTGDWTSWDGARARVPADSDDELGDSARAFNQLVDAIDRLHAVEAELEVSRSQARTDELTGLGNRRHFYLATQAQLEVAPPGREPFALLLIDLDRFKEINDALGHHVGDELLRQLARRLEDALPEAVVLARLGGDEFVALLPPGTGVPQAVRAAERFAATLEAPFELDGLLAHVAASVGVAVHPEHGDDRSTLLRHADVAMYAAKSRGGGVAVYASGDDAESLDRVVLAGDLSGALARDELVLHYQPKAELPEGTVSATEALVRWQHPTRGILDPAAFLGLAEQHGLMRRLTLRVLELAIAQALAWRGAGRDLPVAVNLHAADLIDVRFPRDVAELLERSGAAPELLQLEISEDTIMVDPDRVLAVVARLRELGLQLSLDDFGTGYSSLAYLKRLPIQELKIDRSFVMEMEHSRDDAVIVRSTVELARSLGLRVVAEGVETRRAWERLVEFGCHAAQGFLLSPPLPAAELDAWLDARPRRAGDQGARTKRMRTAVPPPSTSWTSKASEA